MNNCWAGPLPALEAHQSMNNYDVRGRLDLFPHTTTIGTGAASGQLAIAGCDLSQLATEYGTPLYLYDRSTLDAALHEYQQALTASYPGPWTITYAGKAFLCLAMAQWVHRQGLWLDCSGHGELAIAVAAGVPRSQLVAHGVNKGPADLAAALASAGILVIDNLHELARLPQLAGQADQARQPLPDLWLRLRPGVTVESHSYTQTGQEDSKFGMSPAETQAAVRLCLQHSLPLTGLHFHLGSQFRNPDPIGPALDRLLDLIVHLQKESGWTPQFVSTGGGWGVAYHEDDLPHSSIASYVRFVSRRLLEGCRERRLAPPHLCLEPGRSLVARAGVALYRIGLVKQTPHRRWLLVDGGLADNPRPALYGARYSALPIEQLQRPAAGPAWVAGPYCESSDVLIEALPLPDVQPDELLAVPVSGAYQLSMASNYNGACKPAVLWLDKGQTRLIQRREETHHLTKRDLPLGLMNL